MMYPQKDNSVGILTRLRHKLARLLVGDTFWADTSHTEKHQTETRRAPLPDHLHFLNESAFKLVDLPDEESIYTYMGETLQHLLDGEAIVLINRAAPDGESFTIQGIYGIDETQLGKVFKLLGYSPVGATYQSDPVVTPLFKRGNLVQFEGGLVELARRVVPPVITRQLVKLFNLGTIYVIGLRKGDQFFAGVQFYMRGEHTIAYPELIEAFIQQASTALQRIQAIDSWKASQVRYRSLFEQSNDAVFILDLEGNHVQVNQRASEMMGYRPEEIIGLSYRDMVIAQQHDRSDNVLQRLLSGEQVRPYERTFRHKDGHAIPTEVNVDMVRNDNGKPVYIQSIVRDITERKRMEQALKASEERLRIIVDNIPIMIGFFDGTGQFEFVNQHWIDTLGWTVEELAAYEEPLAVFYPDPDYRQQVLDFMLSAEPGWRDFETLTKSGETLTTSWANVRLSDGRAIGIGQDVTERKQIEDELRQINERYDELVKNIPAMVYRVRLTPELEYSFDYLSPRCKEFTGYEIDEVMKNPDLLPQNFSSSEAVARHWELMIESMNTLQPYQFEAQIEVNRQQRWIRLESHPRKLENGDVTWDGLHQDITDQKLAQERELELKLEQERRHLLTTFFQNAAHEFRTPLATINSGIYLMSRSDDPDRRAQKAEQIEMQVKRITRLVDSLLLMTRLESNGTLATDQVDIASILQSVCAAAEKTCARVHQLTCDTAPDLPSILGDADYLSDAFQQIIDNACRFTPEGGKIEVQARSVDDHIWIEIRDSGSGIPQDVLPRIFETFWRKDAAHTTPGFGLGLPIAQQIVERHGGTITVESEEGHGTTIRVILTPSPKDWDEGERISRG